MRCGSGSSRGRDRRGVGEEGGCEGVCRDV